VGKSISESRYESCSQALPKVPYYHSPFVLTKDWN